MGLYSRINTCIFYCDNILEGILRHTLIFMLSLLMLSPAAAKRYQPPDMPSEPATPLSAFLPPLPDACAGQPTVSGDRLYFITLYGIINWEGRATQVEVQEPSDACLREAAIEAVRDWQFEPVDPNTDEFWRLKFETTLIYSPDEAPRFEMRANDAQKIFPPQYPEGCLSKARATELVAITFDVTEEGDAENIESLFSTLPCLERAAEKSVQKGAYAPRLINGRSYPRKQVHTEITFELVDLSPDPVSRKIALELISVAVTLNRKIDPRIALEKISLIEKRYEDELRENEKAILLRFRGVAKIDALDYQGALDDLKQALGLEKNAATADGIKNLIRQLESALNESNQTTLGVGALPH